MRSIGWASVRFCVQIPLSRKCCLIGKNLQNASMLGQHWSRRRPPKHFCIKPKRTVYIIYTKQKLAMHPQKQSRPSIQTCQPSRVRKRMTQNGFFTEFYTGKLQQRHWKEVKNTANYRMRVFWFAFMCIFRATHLGMRLRSKMEKPPGIYWCCSFIVMFGVTAARSWSRKCK